MYSLGVMLRRNLRLNYSRVRRFVDYPTLCAANRDNTTNMTEVIQRNLLLDQLNNPVDVNPGVMRRFHESKMTDDELKLIAEAGLITFLLHVESRIASSVGQGFYTIGPCGEELMAAAGLNIRETDPMALHYRHVAVSVMRQLRLGRTAEKIILDRARGYTCSVNDPITGGRHCAIGGTDYDFIVTSTLASQAPPAVGRALGIPLSHHLSRLRMLEGGQAPTFKLPLNPVFPKDAVSVVSVGEGSTNNAHFLAALNLAEYSAYNKQKCPVVFVVTDNGMCISLRDNGWVNRGATSRLNMHRLTADGADVCDIFVKSREAMNFARDKSRPVLLLVKNLKRRFGHAATDRQFAYMTEGEVAALAETNHLKGGLELARTAGVFGDENLAERYRYLWDCTEKAFAQAANEEKITNRENLCASNAPPLVAIPSHTERATVRYSGLGAKSLVAAGGAESKKRKVDSMRKHMTRLFDEALGGGTAAGERVVYMGEDVRHGGYYLVTDGLYKKYPARVHDFPPDETTLLGAGHGFSQAGMVPIVEIPYAKYLDCGADMFYEIIITHWLTNGRQRDGMVIRLQGFDKGKFGGNFHTHNTIYTPPGLDVVCYSNGADYVRGMRYALRQAAHSGRISMFVDSTDLLNRRHLGMDGDMSGARDDAWLTEYPEWSDSTCVAEMSYDDVVLYRGDWSSGNQGPQFIEGHPTQESSAPTVKKGKLCIVSFGNGVPSALQAMQRMINNQNVAADEIAVIDSPYLSSPPAALVRVLQQFDHVVFADVSKEGASMIFGGFVVQLQNKKLLGPSWRVVGAQPTYNPLGQLLTFLSSEDIESAAHALLNIK